LQRSYGKDYAKGAIFALYASKRFIDFQSIGTKVFVVEDERA
jgi:hypothetical protein